MGGQKSGLVPPRGEEESFLTAGRGSGGGIRAGRRTGKEQEDSPLNGGKAFLLLRPEKERKVLRDRKEKAEGGLPHDKGEKH